MTNERAPRETAPESATFDHILPTGNYLVQQARERDLEQLARFVRNIVPDIAATEVAIRRTLSINPNSILVIRQATTTVGVYGLLLLNAAGLEALLLGELKFADPAPDHIAKPGERVAGIYLWVACAPGLRGAATGQVVRWLQQYEFRSANLFARPATASGQRWMTEVGFEPIICGQSDLWRYVRAPVQPANATTSLTTEETLYELPHPYNAVAWSRDAEPRAGQYFHP